MLGGAPKGLGAGAAASAPPRHEHREEQRKRRKEGRRAVGGNRARAKARPPSMQAPPAAAHSPHTRSLRAGPRDALFTGSVAAASPELPAAATRSVPPCRSVPVGPVDGGQFPEGRPCSRSQ
ncbi:hypothetical protein NDU88_005083 [Pleurodeles waltl]|uniref:Uncharacterized protein n=1 Tax=Pleurodeles waltl TaxID=8319 RepID=A0AAV7WTT2_PLEWA|nr:hypothetical protein NDU88_005083 [Pleurodeles waltl]